MYRNLVLLLQILGWEHPYRTLTMTLVSQGHIGPRKAALEGSPVPEFTRSSNRMDHPSGVQPTDCEYRSTTEPNIRSSAGIAEFLKIAERNSQVSEKLEKEICGKVSFFADAIRPDPSYSPDTEDFSYCSNAIEVLAYGEEDDTAGNFEGDLSLWTSSASLGQVDSFEMSSRQTSGITDLQLSHSSKLGSRQGNALPESITNGFGDDQGFYFEEITSTESKDNSIVCTSDQEDQFIAEVYKCTDGDIVVPMSRTQKSRSLQDFDVWQCPISTDKKRQPSVDISGSTPPLSSELIMRKLTEENSSHNAATSHAKDYMSVDAQDMSDTHTFSLAGKTRFEDFISRLERTSHHRAQFPESSLPKASEGPVFGGPSFSKNNHSLPDLNNPSSRSCGSIPSGI